LLGSLLGENDGVSKGLVEGEVDPEGLADGEDCGIAENDGCNDGEAGKCMQKSSEMLQ
jgi:hypothetical protein